ncbi:MAG: hypothetical protein FWD91_02195, partial [Treponema sp.]|nr:hypothetical protein [Treponema sp.]
MAVSDRMSKVSSFIAALCILIYITAVGFGVARVVMDVGQRRGLATRELNELTDRLSTSASYLGFMSPAYQQNIQDYMSVSRTLAGVIISSSGGDFAFERFAGRSVERVGTTFKFINRIDFPAQPLSLPLRISGQAQTSIQAIYSTINTAFLLVVLRDTLFAVLIALTVSFIMLIIELAQKNRPAVETAKGAAVADFAPPDYSDSSNLDTELFPSFDEDSPQGLFTKRGNIGWESYTHDRLAAELRRCSANQQDLVFLIMEFRCKEEIGDTLYRQFAEQAVSFFT